MIALAYWLLLSLLVGWLVGAFARAGQAEPTACNQNCRQGRDCGCGMVRETPP